MRKPTTIRQLDNRMIKMIGRIRERLEPPRPASLRPGVAWGISWDAERTGREGLAVVLIVHSVDRKWLIPEDQETAADGWNPLTLEARKAIFDFCHAVTRTVGVPCRYTWTLGCRPLSEGDLVGCTK